MPGNGASAAAPPGGTQPDLVNGFRYGRTGQRSQDQVPYLYGWFHEEVSDDHRCFRVQVTRILDSITLFRSYLTTIRTDQGPEFTCRALGQWAFEHGAERRLVQPVEPTQNALIKSLNGRFRDECLNEPWFSDILHTRKMINDWRQNITSGVPIHRRITRHQFNSQGTGETGNMKKNQPTLLTEGCIWSWGLIRQSW